MIKPRFTGKALKNHFDYMGWMYILIPIVLAIFWSLAYSVTQYRPPEDKILSFYMVGNSMDQEKTDALAAEVAPVFPEMEEFDFMPVVLEDVNDYQNWQRFTTLVFAQQGDVYLMDAEVFDSLCADGAFLPLDGLVETDIDLSSTTRATDDDPEPHVYAIPADSLYGLFTNEYFDMRRTVLAVMVFSTNPEESVELVQWLVDNRAGEKPPNFDNLPEKKPFYPENLAIDMPGGTAP